MVVIEADTTFCSLIIFLLAVHVLELLRVSILCMPWLNLPAQKAITPFISAGISLWLAGNDVQTGFVLKDQPCAEISCLILDRGT